MKTLILSFCFFLSIPIFISAQETPPLTADEVLSPYFFIPSDDFSLDLLPLKKTWADVSIAGVIAKVKVSQVFKNEGKRPIEAIYVFPGSSRSAVYAMQMTIGARIIEATIEERQKARQQYEDAKNEGKTASLLEQQRPNVFQMNVANIMPGDEILVEMSYAELLVPVNGTYEFTYPAVVGPRYSTIPKEGALDINKWVENPYLHQGNTEPYDFDMNVQIQSGIPIKQIVSPTHKINVNYETPNKGIVSLNEGKGAGTKDYILRYNLEGNTIETGMLLYPGSDENFFLLMAEPPKEVTSTNIPPREYIFVVDVSGSMTGFPLDTSKQVMDKILRSLRPMDYFNVLAFAGASNWMFPQSIAATQQNIGAALSTIQQFMSGGGTELSQAMQKAISLPRQEENIARIIITLTDGYIAAETGVFDLIRSNMNQSNFFAIGIGSSPNRFLIEGIAYTGKGEPYFVAKPEEIDKNVDIKYMQEPVLTQIKAEADQFGAYDVEPPQIPDLFSQRPVVVIGKYKGAPTGSVTISGYTADGIYEKTLAVTPAMEDKGNEALRYLWARQRIKLLSDYNSFQSTDARVKEITELGLRYNLLTQYTSFIAIESEIRNVSGELIKVQQPIPLPEGVSDNALPGGTGDKDGNPGGIGGNPGNPSVPVHDWDLYGFTSEYFYTKDAEEIENSCKVLSVIDAKTIQVLYKGNVETVVLLGVDLPVLGEPGYEKALEFLKNLVEKKCGILEFVDKNLPVKDKNGVLKAYLIIDGINISKKLVDEGFARILNDNPGFGLKNE